MCVDSDIHTFFPIPFSAAIQALKRKKRYEKQLQQIDGTLSTIEMQRVALEEANTNTSVITTMKNAADALKNAHQHMYATFLLLLQLDSDCQWFFCFAYRNVDQVHDMMDDIAEQQDLAKEIGEAISNPVAFGMFIWCLNSTIEFDNVISFIFERFKVKTLMTMSWSAN